MPELLSVLVYNKLYKILPPNAKFVWDQKVVEPFKTMISVGFTTYSFALGLFSPIIVLLAALLTTSYYWHGFVLAYLTWYIYDYNTPFNGKGRVSEWLRHSYIYKTLVGDYFSMKIIKNGTSANMDPKKNYMIGYHPHGNAPIGYFCGFGTEAASYSQHFPHHDRHLFNHKMMFVMPFIRELQIAWGCHTVDKKVMNSVMSKYTGCHNTTNNNDDNSSTSNNNNNNNDNNNNDSYRDNDNSAHGDRKSLFIIIPGGIDEMMKTRTNVLDLTIKNRKGFVKLAIEHGIDLVPAIGFGETELWGVYRPPKGSILFWIQDFARRHISRFSLNYPIGCGLTPNSRGILPRRKPLTIVLGNIIPVDKCDAEPSKDYVDEVHEQYVREIERLFNETKDLYAPPGYELVLH